MPFCSSNRRVSPTDAVLAVQERQILCSMHTGRQGAWTDSTAQPELTPAPWAPIPAGSPHTQEDPTLLLAFGMSQNCPELLSNGVGDLFPAVPAWIACAATRASPATLTQFSRGQRNSSAAQALQELGQESLVLACFLFRDKTTSLHLCTSS